MNQNTFVKDMCCVFFEVWTEFLNSTYNNFKGLIYVSRVMWCIQSSLLIMRATRSHQRWVVFSNSLDRSMKKNCLKENNILWLQTKCSFLVTKFSCKDFSKIKKQRYIPCTFITFSVYLECSYKTCHEHKDISDNRLTCFTATHLCPNMLLSQNKGKPSSIHNCAWIHCRTSQV
jgi:hypothetical protein